MRTSLAAAFLTLAVTPAFAAGVKPPPKPPETNPIEVNVQAGAKASSSSHAGAVAVSHNEQAQQQGQIQGQQQVATGGHSEAHGGNAVAVGQGGQGGDAQAHAIGVGGAGGNATGGSSDAAASANNEGNTLTVQTTYRQVRQAPPVSQGSLMIGQCGAGVNGGGSGTGGAGFLGIAWTPRECHKYLTAANYAALGMHSFACAILNTTKATRETVDALGIDVPSCDFFEKTVTVEEVRYVTEDELDAAVMRLQERQDRAWQSVQGQK